MILGMDYLGGAKYPEIIIKHHPPGMAAGFFLSTFGDSFPVIKALAATGKAPIIRVHALYRTDHNFSDGRLSDKAIAEAVRLDQVAKAFPSISFSYSPFVEHMLPPVAMRPTMQAIEKYTKNLHLINNGLDYRYNMRAYQNELHATLDGSPRPYQFSFDGVSSVDADIEKFKFRHKNATIMFLWCPSFNLKARSDETTPIEQRRTRPTKEIIESLVALTLPKGKTSLPDKWLFKSHAEDSGDGRANRPCMICPVKTERIELRNSTEHLIETMKFYGPYVDGRFRYYADTFGYQIADAAEKAEGSRLTSVWANKVRCGTINAAFRQAEFRNT